MNRGASEVRTRAHIPIHAQAVPSSEAEEVIKDELNRKGQVCDLVFSEDSDGPMVKFDILPGTELRQGRRIVLDLIRRHANFIGEVVRSQSDQQPCAASALTNEAAADELTQQLGTNVINFPRQY